MEFSNVWWRRQDELVCLQSELPTGKFVDFHDGHVFVWDGCAVRPPAAPDARLRLVAFFACFPFFARVPFFAGMAASVRRVASCAGRACVIGGGLHRRLMFSRSIDVFTVD